MRPIRPVLGGAALGLATLTGFSFVGVPVVPTDAHGLPLAGAPHRPLAPALLSAADLPPGFTPGPLGALPPGADGCALLLADPATGWAGAVRRRHARPDAALWEALATPAGDAVGRLFAQLSHCPGVRPLAPDVVAVPGGYVAAARAGTTTVVLRYAGPDDPALAATVILPTALAKLARAPGAAAAG
jgi:hypothetical protein